ncbi:MAG: hypothetical protein H0U13_11975 [Gemmatimonadaceae bacterium]|nr:hypothetical protein [Gemmatimonadaceae bacterium]
MKKRHLLALPCSLLFAFPVASRAQEVPAHEHAPGAHSMVKLGTVSFPNSGSRSAQTPFLRGLALLHSFEYEDAAEAFREAQRADAGFAVAYWGEALTYAKLLWGLDDPAAARSVLARLAPTPAARLGRAGTEREEAYGSAIEALYQEGDLPTRIRGYVAALRTLTAAHPTDVEARALLAIALQMGGAGYTGAEAKGRRLEAIDLAKTIFAAQPDHPGGAHYLIHATDHPEFAAHGLAAARAYAEIAPDAEHALHMPSHIFVQIGAWDDAVASNERAWAASRASVKARRASNTDLSFHTLWWLQYGYLQQGRYAAAKAVVDSVDNLLAGIDWAKSDAIDARFAPTEFRFTYATETGDWSVFGSRAPEVVRAGSGGTSQRAQGFAFANAYNVAFAAGMMNDTAAAATLTGMFAGDGARRTIARAHIAALVARARGQGSLYLESLRAAAEADAQIVHFGPPNMVPAHELLGNALLEAKLLPDAISAFEKSLQLMPNRSASLLGLARAQRAVGDEASARKSYARLVANWRAADATMPAVKAALDESRRSGAQ